MSPHEYCQQRAVPPGSSAHYSFLFLPEDRRRAVTALYAFRREVNDVVDETRDAGVARAKLAWWRGEIDNVYGGTPQHPVARALAESAAPYGIEKAHLFEIVDGATMDLDYNAYPDFEALKVYCHRVAGVVAVLSARIFGYRNSASLDYAADLGLALQLTDIVQAVGEDARRHHIYLPLHELAEYGVTTQDIEERRESDDFRRLMDFQVTRARAQFERALAKLPPEDRRAQRPGLVMAAISRTLLDEIRRDGSHVLQRRVVLTPVRKLWIACKTWVKNR